MGEYHFNCAAIIEIARNNQSKVYNHRVSQNKNVLALKLFLTWPFYMSPYVNYDSRTTIERRGRSTTPASLNGKHMSRNAHSKEEVQGKNTP